MSYDFTKGKYRAFIRTTYLDEAGVSQTVDGEPETFDSEAVSYFTFKTNSDIKLDPETLEVPNAELTDSGTYKGLEYSFYDNGLAVISGTQDEAVANTDATPWQSDISYIFVKATVTSGFVFRNDDCLELQVGYLGFSGDPYPTQLFNGTSYLYLNVSNIDLTTTNRVGPMFYGVSTDDIDGLEDLVNNLPSNITSATSFLGYMEIKGTKSLSFNVSISNFDSHSASGMFGLCGSNCDVTVHTDVVDYQMFGGNADTSNSYLKSLTVIVDSCPADKDYVYMFYRCAAKKITIQQMPMPDPANVPTSFTLMKFFANCLYLEELVINSDSDFTFNYRSLSGLFEDCSSLKRIRDEWYHDYIIETSNWFYAPRAFKNCSSLEIIPFDDQCQDFPQLYTATEMFYNCFHETEDAWPYLIIGTKGANFENAFENSHFRGVHLIFKKYTGSSISGINLKEAFKNSDLQLIQFEWDALAYSSYGANAGFISAAEGCTKLKTFQSLIPSNYYPYIVRFDRMFYGCTALEDVSLQYMRCTNTGDYPRNAITEDCFTGCTALKTFTTPSGDFNPFVLPKTMYYNGTAYTEAALVNKTYTSTS